MSGISSGIGLISGIDTASLINQLIALESRPLTVLNNRKEEIGTQQAAFLELSAQLLAIQNAVLGFDDQSFFRRFGASSTNKEILTATAGKSAAPGSHTFRVHSLVTSHAVLSRGFADADKAPIGVGAITIESGRALVNKSTDLDTVNGGAGVRRGVITITTIAADGTSIADDIDLTTAVTVNDVLDAINRSATLNVRASVTSVASGDATGDRIVIEDLSEAPGQLIITDERGGFAAKDLGIAGTASGRLDGNDLVLLSKSTSLSLLNDGNGIGRLGVGATNEDGSRAFDLLFDVAGPSAYTFHVSLTGILAQDLDTDLRALNGGNGVRLGTIQIKDRNDESVEVDLSTARTVRDVIETTNAATKAAGVSVSLSVANSFFQFTDTTGAADEVAKNLVVKDVTGFTAADLGIVGDEEDNAIVGPDVYSISTVGDIINAINFAADNNDVFASISEDGNGISLRVPGDFVTVSVRAGEGSTAAADLGLLDATATLDSAFRSRDLIASLNTVLLQSLRGGSGVTAGIVSLTDRAGATAEIDLTGAQTLQEVIDRINADANTQLVAAVNQAGNGLELRDESGALGPIAISDVTGSLATDLGIAGSFTAADKETINGGNLQLQYVSRRSLLSELNSGQGISLGRFLITDSNGSIFTVDLPSNLTRVADILDAINRATPDTINARINDTGDGITITDSVGGPKPLEIEDVQGQTAANLRIAGTARSNENFIDGSFEVRINIDARDTLDDLVRKINNSGANATASILNDGSTSNPASLTITSGVTGRRGQLVIDSGRLDLGLRTLTRAQDATVTIGGASATSPLLVSSPNNTLDNVIPGVTLNLLAPGDEDVTVSIAQDLDGIVDAVGNFVQQYNNAQQSIDDATSFDSDTLEQGPLLGDGTVNQVRSRLHNLILRPFEGADPSVSRLVSIGLRLGANNRLEFDEDRFREAYDQTPDLVEQLFTAEGTGFGAVLEDTLKEMTRDVDGLIARRSEALTQRQDLLDDRVEQLNTLLAAKRRRLESQFAGLEISLARLQDQQTSLIALGQLAAG